MKRISCPLFGVFGVFFCLLSGLASAGPDLSTVEYLSESDDYQVSVDGVPLFVYKSSKNGSHNTAGLTSMSFVNFDMNGPVSIEVTSTAAVSSYEIRPYSENIVSSRSGNTISFTLNEPKKLMVRLNGSYDKALIVCANPVHTPPDPGSVEYYFGPGVHHIGYRMPLGSNDDVYIAEGAVVEGSFNVSGSNITITGRGVMALGEWPHQEDFSVIRGRNTSNVLIEGITICNAPGWIISFWWGSDGLTVRNVKEIGNWLYNTDGVQTGTNGLLVEDCFLQCNDDNFSLNGTCTNVEIRNNVFWNIYNGGLFMLGWGITYLADMDIHDNVILRTGGCCSHHRKGPFSMKLENSGAEVENIYFTNIIVEELVQWGNWIHFTMEAPGTVHDIYFDNIDIQNMTWGPEGLLGGYDESNRITDVYFTDLRINGQLIENAQQAGLIMNNTSNIQFLESTCGGSISAEWTSSKIGLGYGVCAREDAGIYTVEGNGGGAGIGGYNDSFHFVHQDVSGDIDLIACVNGQDSTYILAKAGVMVRESTEPNALFATVIQRPDKQVMMQWRIGQGQSTSGAQTLTGGTDEVKYVRLVRFDDVFKAYYSVDSADGPWTQIGTDLVLEIPDAALAGLCVTSAQEDAVNTAEFQEVSLQWGTGELLVNSGFEEGLAGWSEYNGSICDAAIVSDPNYEGTQAVSIYNRTGKYTGIQQDITNTLLTHGPGEYAYSAYVRTETGTLPLYAILRIDDNQGTRYLSGGTVTADSSNWKQSRTTLLLNWDGLTLARFYVETNSDDLYTFYVDGCSLMHGSGVIADLPPGQAGNLQLSGGHEKIDLAWQAPVDEGSSNISGYKIYRGLGLTGALSQVDAIGLSKLYSDETVSNGQEYSYAVAAVNDSGTGAQSSRQALTAVWNEYDLNKDGIVDLEELALFCEAWLWQGTAGGHAYDFAADGVVNLRDAALLAQQWLWQAPWH